LKSASSQVPIADAGLRIGEVADRAGVNTSLIRYYERVGLLPPPERVSGQRRYDASVLRRLAVIDVAQRAGLSLHEIGGLLEIGTDPLSERLQDLAQRKLPEIEALIERAERVRAWLTTATGCGCQGVDECALFDDDVLPAGNGTGLAVLQVPARTRD
jgi:MerR family redox-sensitive transcriptional activator SoxR